MGKIMWNEAKVKVLKFVKVHPLATAEDLATALSISVESAQMEASRLTRQGLLTRQQGQDAGKKRRYYYSISGRGLGRLAQIIHRIQKP
jgi:DNA-binding MarR family transcriptional regulator